MSQDNQEFVLLSYDNENRNSVLALVSPDGTVTNSQNFTIGEGEGVEAPIVEHYTRTGRQLPFQSGRLDNGTYYFNGFYNYTLSLVFTDLTNGVTGVVQGQQDDGGFSAVLPLGGQGFAISRFDFGDNYLSPVATLNTSGTTSSVDVDGNPILELVPNAALCIERMTIDERDVLVYAGTTKNGQVILVLYDAQDGSWLGTDYLGFSNPFEVKALHPTEDGGLTVLAQTSVAGRFPRTSLFKLSSRELEKKITVK